LNLKNTVKKKLNLTWMLNLICWKLNERKSNVWIGQNRHIVERMFGPRKQNQIR
jgi:bisphosphoglycerate-dependent phosphoglycerate mutase